MAPIGKKQIIESDEIKKAFEDVNAAATSLTGQLALLSKEGAELAKALALGKTTSTENAKAAKEYEKILAEKYKTEKQLTELERVKLKLSNEVAAAEAKKTKESEKAAKAAAQEASAYARLSKQHTEARNKAKDLAVQYGINSKAAKDAAAAANKLDAQLKKIDASLGQHQRNVGNYGKAWQGLGRGLMGAFGITVGLSSIGSAMKSAFNKQVEFEKGLSSLSSITGLAGKQLQNLGKKAKQMSKDSTVSAVDTLKAMELIGSAKPELLKSSEALASVTDAAITLSEAAGMELPVAAEALTDAMNQFGLGADQAARVINVLAAGSKEGAAAIPAVTEAMKQFGTVAKGANISIEESTALIEALAERGVKGAEAGTKLRNFLLTLQAGAKETNPAVVGLNTALENLRKQNLSATEATKLFGKENVVAAQILMESVPTIDRLTKAVTDTNTAYEQAAINTDNFAGASKRLGNAWDDVLLSLGNTQIATDAINALTRGLNNLSFAMKSTEDQGAELAAGALKKLDDSIASLSKEDKLKALVLELEIAKRGFDDSNKVISAASTNWASFKDAVQDVLDPFNLLTKSQADSAEAERANAEAYKVRIKAIQERLAALTQSWNSEEEAKKDDAGATATVTIATRDLIKEKEKELALVRDTPAATEAETLARNIKVKTIEEEIKRLRELGTIKAVSQISFDTKEIDSVKDYLKESDEQYFASQIELWEKERAELEEHERQKAEIRRQYAETVLDGIWEIEQTLFDNKAQAREDDYNAEMEEFDKRLANEKLDDEQRAEIEKERDARERQLKTRNARAAKQDALFQILIGTSMGVMKTIATLGFPAAWAQIPFVLIQGALQSAAVAARAIPKYFKGTDNHPGGLAVVGDGGKQELVEEPSGKTYLTPSTATVMDLPRGTKVVPGHGVAQRLSELTQNEMISLAKGFQYNDRHVININTDELLAEQVRTRKAIEATQSRVSDASIRERVRFELQREKMRN